MLQPQAPDSNFPIVAFMLFFFLQMVGEGLLWGIAGFVAFRLARVRNRLWPVAAMLTGLAATTAEWLGFYVSDLLSRRLEANDPIMTDHATLDVVTGAMAFSGFVIAWMVLRRRLFATPATSADPLASA